MAPFSFQVSEKAASQTAKGGFATALGSNFVL
jgi:hypothetical protein